jgi:tetratricopeptide (TPR) repeat protein
MKLKYILGTFLIAAGALGAPGCNKKLDIEPQQSIDATGALTTADDVNAAVIGTYSLLGLGSLYGTNLFMLADLQASEEYANWAGTFQGPRQVADKSMTRDNSEAARTWNNAYRAINMANIVLGAIDVVEDPDLKDQYEGEALFIRGILHFELVRFYALPWDATPNNDHKGVVIRTEGFLNEAPAAPRSTVAQVYAQVIADLTAASAKLPENNGDRANRYAALAFLSRVYLQQGNYALARDAANEVIEQGSIEPGFSMSNNIMQPFTEDNAREVIWEIEQDVQNNAGDANDGLATFYSYDFRAELLIDETFYNSYDPADKRKALWYYEEDDVIYTSKWSSASQNLPVVRLAEMYLTRAECNLRLGEPVGAAEDLAMVRNMARVNLAPIAEPTLDDILLERWHELAFEGMRIHDIKRVKDTIIRYKTNGEVDETFPWNDDDLVFPIPAQEVSASSGIIEQNPGY